MEIPPTSASLAESAELLHASKILDFMEFGDLKGLMIFALKIWRLGGLTIEYCAGARSEGGQVLMSVFLNL